MVRPGRRKMSALALGVVSMAVLLAGLAPIARAGDAPAPAVKATEVHPKPIFHLSLTIWSCQAKLLLNGFPLISLSAENEQPVTFSPPVNPYLAGKRNRVEIELRPAVRPDGTELPFANANFEMEVREYQQGGVVEPGGGGPVTRFSMPASVRKQLKKGKKVKLPLKFTHGFANGGGIDFSAELLDASPFSDRKAVADYAMHLRDLMAKGDVDGLMAEYEFKVGMGAAAYGKQYQRTWENTRAGLAEFIQDKPELDFGPADLELHPWCGGRIWQLSRKGGTEFVLAASGRSKLRAFVGLREGKLRVVR
jgi:hypothetical protein